MIRTPTDVTLRLALPKGTNARIQDRPMEGGEAPLAPGELSHCVQSLLQVHFRVKFRTLTEVVLFAVNRTWILSIVPFKLFSIPTHLEDKTLLLTIKEFLFLFNVGIMLHLRGILVKMN